MRSSWRQRLSIGEGHKPGGELHWIEVRHFLTGCLFYAQPTFHVGGDRSVFVWCFFWGRVTGNGVRGMDLGMGETGERICESPSFCCFCQARQKTEKETLHGTGVAFLHLLLCFFSNFNSTSKGLKTNLR